MQNNNGKIHFAIELSLEQLERGVRQGQVQLRSLADTAEEQGARIDNLTKRIGKAVTGIFSARLAEQFARQVITIRGQIQQLEIAFTTLTGSQERAQELMAELTETAARTPFDLMGISQGAKQLMAYGVEAEKVNDTLKMLGDIASGLSIPLGDLVYLYGTTITQGRMYTMDLRQFMARGIPLAEALSDQFKVAKEEVAGLVAEGKVGAEEFKKAIASVRETKFPNLMEKQSSSLTGQIANLQDAIAMMMNDIGKQTEGVASKAIGAASTLVENYEKVVDIIAVLVATYGTYKAATIATIAITKLASAVEHRHGLAILFTRKAQEALNTVMARNPYAIVAAALAALITVLWRYARGADASTKATEEFKEAQREAAEAVDDHRTRAEQLLTTIRDANETNLAREEAYQSLIALYPDLLTKIDLEKLKTMQLADAIKLLNEERDKARIGAKRKAVEDAQRDFNQAAKKYHDTRDALDIIGIVRNADAGDKMIKARERLRLAREDLAKTEKAIENARKRAEEAAATEEEKELTEEEKEKQRKRLDQARKAAEERLQAERQLADKEMQASLELRQMQVDAMSDGAEKELAANELAHDRLMLQIRQQEQEWVDLQAKAKGRKKGTLDDLTDAQKQTLEMMRKEAESAFAGANKRTLESALDGVRTYEQERLRIQREYQEKRAALQTEEGALIAGASQGNLDEIARQEEEALARIDEQFASRETTYRALIRRVSSLGLDALKDTLEEAEKALQQAEKSGATGTKLAQARATVRALKQQIEEATASQEDTGDDQDDSTEKQQQALADWKELYETLGRIKKSFDEIGDSLGGVAGRAIKTSGVITASAMQMINGITTLANWSIRAQELTAKGASRAVQSVERASVILAVASAALQVISTIKNVIAGFRDENEQARQDAIKSANGVKVLNTELATTREKAEQAGRALRIFSGDGFNDATRSVQQAQRAFKRYTDELHRQVQAQKEINDSGSWIQFFYGVKIDDLETEAQKYGRIISQIQIQTQKATGFDFGPFHIGKRAKYKSLRELVPELFDPDESINKDALAKFIGSEVYDKLPDKVKASLAEVKKAQDDYVENTKALESYLRGVFGELGADLMKDIVGAFRSGEDASERFAKTVSRTLEKLVTDMIFSSVFSDTFRRAEEQMKTLTEKGATQEEFIHFYSTLMDQVKALKHQADTQLENAKDAGRRSGLDLFVPEETTQTRREASRKGLAQASQDSVDELSGRATTIQGHTHDISSYTKLLVANSTAILGRVTEIRDNTNRLERIEGATAGLKRAVDDIALKGVKIKA